MLMTTVRMGYAMRLVRSARQPLTMDTVARAKVKLKNQDLLLHSLSASPKNRLVPASLVPLKAGGGGRQGSGPKGVGVGLLTQLPLAQPQQSKGQHRG